MLEICDGETKQRAMAAKSWATGQCGKSQNCPSAFRGYVPVSVIPLSPWGSPCLVFCRCDTDNMGTERDTAEICYCINNSASHPGIFLSISYWAFCLPAIETDVGRAGCKPEPLIIRAKGALPGLSLLPGWLWRLAREIPAAFVEKLKVRRPTGPVTQPASVQKRVRSGQAGHLSLGIL